jgi:hypothetical protein
MHVFIARLGLAVAILSFVAMSAAQPMEPAAAQEPTPVPTPVIGAPTVIVQIDDDEIDAGDDALITLIAFDDEGLEWIRWDARLVDDDEDDNDNESSDDDSNENAAVASTVSVVIVDNDNGEDDDNSADIFDNDNFDPNADPALTTEQEFDCDEQTACANVWTIKTSKPGQYEIVGEARDTAGIRVQARAELEVR